MRLYLNSADFILRMSVPATRLKAPRPRDTSPEDFPYNRGMARVALIAFGRSIYDSDKHDFISNLECWMAALPRDWEFRLCLFVWQFDTSLEPEITTDMINCISGLEERRKVLRAAWQGSKYSVPGKGNFENVHTFISTFWRILVSFACIKLGEC